MGIDRRDRQKVLDAQIIQNGDDLRGVLLGARDKIQADIIKATKSGNVKSAAWLQNNLYKDLKNQYLKLQGNLDGWAADSVKEGSEVWVGFAAQDLGIAPKTAWNRFSKDYLDLMIQQYSPSTMGSKVAVNAGDLAPQLGGMLKRDIDIVRQAVMDTNRLQGATGLSPREWEQAVTIQVMESTNNAWNFVDKSGRNWSASNYFNMLNRTLSADVSRDSYISAAAADGYDLYTIEGGIPPNCCPFCHKWAGKIVSVSGTSTVYPSLEEAKKGGVFHPRCRHYLAVMFPGEEEEAAEEEKRFRAEAKRLGNPKTTRLIQPNDVKKPVIKLPDLKIPKKPDVPKPDPEKNPEPKPKPKKVNVAKPAKEVDAVKVDPGQEALEGMKSAEKNRGKIQKLQSTDIPRQQEKLEEVGNAYLRARDQVHKELEESGKIDMRDLRAVFNATNNDKRISSLDAKLAQERLNMTKLEDEVKKLKLEDRDRAWKVFLSPKSKAGTFEADFKSKSFRGKRKEDVEKGVEFSQRLWGSRATTDGQKIRVEAAGNSRSYHYKNTIAMRKNAPPSVTVHEIAHYMEEKDPDLHKRAVDFLIKRSEGKPVERIRDKLNKNYDPEEIAVQDDWKDLYTGKIYVGNTRQQQRRFADKVAGRTFSASEIPELAKDIRATEILSMGAEKLYNDPIKFAQEEPDFFKFMINAAKGVQA